jgi:phosphatidate cytidylyltransferase
LAGNILGKHHLSPRLSPNKTIEGYAGGVIMGTALTVLLAMLLQLPLIQALILGLLITIISPLGDLGISLLKREAGVKDSGTIFGGHGGALDRVDSLIWSVTIAYYLVAFFQVI